MKKRNPIWSVDDFSHAMANAISAVASPKLTKKADNKISFNGFWRNGDKQNICVWLDKATWHDAKTGEGGGCKEFAKTAFNMDLAEFMNRYGALNPDPRPTTKLVPIVFQKKPSIGRTVHELWQHLQKVEIAREDVAGEWLIKKRGIESPRQVLNCGFANLHREKISIFDAQHQSFITHRVSLAPQIVVPLRGTASTEIKNLFFRSIVNVSKEEKSRLLPNVGGWTEHDGSPRAFGFPSLIKDSPHLILCEGMADYFSVKFLINGNRDFLSIGAANADGLSKWAKWLVTTKYKGRVTVLYQIDEDENGALNTKRIGPKKAVEALRYLKENQVHAQLFDWPFYLRHTSSHPSRINDIADSLSTEITYKECGSHHLQEVFLLSLNMKKGS